MGEDYKSFVLQSLTLLLIIIFTVIALLFLMKLFLRNTPPESVATYIDFAKWAAVSIALVIIASIFENNFKDRDSGLNEIKQYDKYVELVVLTDRIGPKWRLSQYFSKVTASDKLRSRWSDYFEIVDKEYKDSIDEIQTQHRKADSLQKIVQSNPNVDTITKQLYQQTKERINNLNSEVDTKIDVTQKSIGNNYNDAAMWEKKGFDFLLNKDVTNAITAFDNADKAYPTFHSVYDIKKLLSVKREILIDKNADEWKQVYNTILSEYSWQLDPDIKSRLKNQ